MTEDPDPQTRFLALLQRHQGALRKVAALYARDRADREDLFQEIALQLWRSFGAFRGESAFSTFLYRVALNTALLRVRRAGHRPRVEDAAAVEEAPAPAAHPAQDDEEVERLYAAVRALPALDRAVVLLVLEGRSYEEIAAVTGLAVGTVGARLSRCKQRLRRRLGAADGGE